MPADCNQLHYFIQILILKEKPDLLYNDLYLKLSFNNFLRLYGWHRKQPLNNNSKLSKELKIALRKMTLILRKMTLV